MREPHFLFVDLAPVGRYHTNRPPHLDSLSTSTHPFRPMLPPTPAPPNPLGQLHHGSITRLTLPPFLGYQHSTAGFTDGAMAATASGHAGCAGATAGADTLTGRARRAALQLLPQRWKWSPYSRRRRSHRPRLGTAMADLQLQPQP